jgi:hypothetical protein
MAKYYGTIGFGEEVETSSGSGIMIKIITEYYYYGDVIRFASKKQSVDKLNDDVNITNRISIIADPYARKNFYAMEYVTYCGSKWKVEQVEVQAPRLVLTIGGIYNG